MLVNKIEVDISSKNHLLVRSGLNIKRIDISAQTPIWIDVLGAQTDNILRFTQINHTFLAVIGIVGKDETCVKTLKRGDGDNVTLAGHCTEEGEDDGGSSEARFTGIRDIIMNRNTNSLLVLQEKRLRSIDVSSGNVTTVINSGQGVDKAITMTWRRETLLLTHLSYISQVIWNNQSKATALKLAGSTDEREAGHVDGPFDDARFYSPRSIMVLFPNIYLMSGQFSDSIRLLDFENKRVLTVNISEIPSAYEDSSKFYCLAKTKNALYLGRTGGITIVSS